MFMLFKAWNVQGIESYSKHGFKPPCQISFNNNQTQTWRGIFNKLFHGVTSMKKHINKKHFLPYFVTNKGECGQSGIWASLAKNE